MDFLFQLTINALQRVWITFTHNWPFLILSVLAATTLKLFMDPQKVSSFLLRYKRAGVIGATLAAVATPLCSCGTTAILLGMMASMMPWAPIVAFMVASPLTSPQELIYSAGLFGWPFAWAFFISSIVLGLLGGVLASILEKRGFLANQARLTAASSPARSRSNSHKISLEPVQASSYQPAPVFILAAEPCCTSSAVIQKASCCEAVQVVEQQSPCGCSTSQSAQTTNKTRVTWQSFSLEAYKISKRLLVMFLGFAFIGYFLNGLIPSAWVNTIFGAGNVYSVPLAATLGLPLYLNTEASLPLVRALMDGGMSQGAALAFLITGAGTSVGAFAGALTIARWRVIALVVGTLWGGAILIGYFYNALTLWGWV